MTMPKCSRFYVIVLGVDVSRADAICEFIFRSDFADLMCVCVVL